jgi:hypothetical protein
MEVWRDTTALAVHLEALLCALRGDDHPPPSRLWKFRFGHAGCFFFLFGSYCWQVVLLDLVGYSCVVWYYGANGCHQESGIGFSCFSSSAEAKESEFSVEHGLFVPAGMALLASPLPLILTLLIREPFQDELGSIGFGKFGLDAPILPNAFFLFLLLLVVLFCTEF